MLEEILQETASADNQAQDAEADSLEAFSGVYLKPVSSDDGNYDYLLIYHLVYVFHLHTHAVKCRVSNLSFLITEYHTSQGAKPKQLKDTRRCRKKAGTVTCNRQKAGSLATDRRQGHLQQTEGRVTCN